MCRLIRLLSWPIAPLLLLILPVVSIGGRPAHFALADTGVSEEAYTPPETGFETGLEGWRLVNATSLQDYAPSDPNAFGAFSGVMLFIRSSNDPSNLGFLAPDKFHGDHHRVYKGQLRFHMGIAGQPSPGERRFVTLSGGGITLNFPLDRPVYHDPLSSIVIPLNENAGWKTAGNVAPTQAEFKSLLGNVTQLLLPAGWNVSTECGHSEVVDGIAYALPAGGEIAVSRTSLNFGRVRAGHSERFEFIVRNISRTEGDVLRVSPVITGDPSFGVTHDGEEIDIQPRHFLRLVARFRPLTSGHLAATISLGHTDQNVDNPIQIELRGVGRGRQ